MNWEEAVDLRLANRNCESDSYGDWYRDPWHWAEMRWIVESRPELLLERLDADGVRPAMKTDVAKENFGTRPAIIMDPLDRIVFQSVVDSLSLDLIGGLRDWVFGWRLPHIPDPKKGAYSRSMVSPSVTTDDAVARETPWHPSRYESATGNAQNGPPRLLDPVGCCPTIQTLAIIALGALSMICPHDSERY